MALNHAPDLTQRAPRSARTRIGGYVILARMLDKGRATLNGKNGEYHFNCPLDQQFTSFAGIDATALKEQLAAGKGDGEILEWIASAAKNKLTPAQIHSWSTYQDQRAPSDVEGRAFFNEIQLKIGPKREDISAWFDVLDLDDYASFGGKV